jgi:hypothetical protein
VSKEKVDTEIATSQIADRVTIEISTILFPEQNNNDGSANVVVDE